MRWEKQVSFRTLLVVAGGFTALLFLMTWSSYGNGPTPKFWGDPISFRDALARIPRIVRRL
jgi:hypothetical protein